MTFDDVRKFTLTWPIRLSKAKRAIVEPYLRRRWRALASKAARTAFDARR